MTAPSRPSRGAHSQCGAAKRRAKRITPASEAGDTLSRGGGNNIGGGGACGTHSCSRWNSGRRGRVRGRGSWRISRRP